MWSDDHSVVTILSGLIEDKDHDDDDDNRRLTIRNPNPSDSPSSFFLVVSSDEPCCASSWSCPTIETFPHRHVVCTGPTEVVCAIADDDDDDAGLVGVAVVSVDIRCAIQPGRVEVGGC
jgi:hypothetical protein